MTKEIDKLRKAFSPDIELKVPKGYHCTSELCDILSMSKSSVIRKLAKLKESGQLLIIYAYRQRSNGRVGKTPYYKICDSDNRISSTNL